jgi:acyl-CoA thioesterase
VAHHRHMAMSDSPHPQPTTDALDGVRPVDRLLLDLEADPDHPGDLRLEVVPKLCRTDGRFYGGAALAASLAAMEAVTGRRALWATTQLVAPAPIGSTVRVGAEVVASGRTVDQVSVRGWVGDDLLFLAVGSAATESPDGIAGLGQRMPDVPVPDDCEPWRGPGDQAAALRGETLGGGDGPAVGHHLVTEHRDAPILSPSSDRPGHFALWARMGGDLASVRPVMTPAILGFVADMVPLAVTRACGVHGAGTSLDNSIRIGDVRDADWVLLDLDASVAAGGFGHGTVNVWSPDGSLLATGSQSARLFSIEDFLRRRDG